MFGFLKSKPIDPPSERQLKYAHILGITVTPRMSKSDVSEAIDVAEKKNPKAKQQRKHINKKQADRAEEKWAKECGPELLSAEKQWSEFAEREGFILAVYHRGKNTVVDVLQVNDAFIDGNKKKKIKLCVASPKVVKDRDLGEYLEWDRDFELALEKILYFESFHAELGDGEIIAYQRAVENGLRKAKMFQAG